MATMVNTIRHLKGQWGEGVIKLRLWTMDECVSMRKHHSHSLFMGNVCVLAHWQKVHLKGDNLPDNRKHSVEQYRIENVGQWLNGRMWPTNKMYGWNGPTIGKEEQRHKHTHTICRLGVSEHWRINCHNSGWMQCTEPCIESTSSKMKWLKKRKRSFTRSRSVFFLS